MTAIQKFKRTGLLALALAVVLVPLAGCAKEGDSSDADPHYYKGKDFVHKKTR